MLRCFRAVGKTDNLLGCKLKAIFDPLLIEILFAFVQTRIEDFKGKCGITLLLSRCNLN
jgi:hypothetical protein